MSQPSENPSSAPAANAPILPPPSETERYMGRIYYKDADGKDQAMSADEYHRLYKLQESAPKLEAVVESASPSLQDEPVAAGESTPEPSRTATDESMPTPSPSREREGSDAAPADQPQAESSGVPTQDWLARGLKHPAGRGWETDGPATAPTAPDRFESIRKFGLAARVRFLDALASHGEVRAAAARAGISHETAYRARRRYADFAQLWDAAMVHARTRAESELGTRALDGVEVPVIVRGEQVGAWRRHDARYLLAHLARLDRHVEAHPEAAARAERFDEMLAAMAGHEMPEHFAGACPDENIEGVPPTREAVVERACGQALDALDEDGEEICEDEEEREAAEDAAIEGAIAEAGAEYDLWMAGSFAQLDQVLEGEEEDEGEGEEASADGSPGDVPLIEYKAIMHGSALRAKLRRSVSHVSTGGSNLSVRPGEGRANTSLPFVIPAEAGTRLQSEPTGSPLSRG